VRKLGEREPQEPGLLLLCQVAAIPTTLIATPPRISLWLLSNSQGLAARRAWLQALGFSYGYLTLLSSLFHGSFHLTRVLVYEANRTRQLHCSLHTVIVSSIS